MIAEKSRSCVTMTRPSSIARATMLSSLAVVGRTSLTRTTS